MRAFKGLCMVTALLMLAGTVMAAGNVKATLQNGNLLIIGDTSSNEIWLTEGSSDTIYVYAYSGTTVNGQGSATFANVTGDIKILMKAGGHNYVYMEYINVNDDLVVAMGGGSDFLELYSVNVHDDAKIAMGDGNNRFYAYYSSIGDKMGLTTKHGSDYIYLYSTGSECKTIINTGKGNDGVECRYGWFDKLTVKAGPGNDWVALGESQMYTLCNLNGNKGWDTLYDYGGNTAGKLKEKGFESGS